MQSLILAATSKVLLPLLLLFSVFLLFRGHYQPGGGFVGGLVAAAAFALFAIASGLEQARRALRVNPRTLIASGLLLALFSGVPALLLHEPFLTAKWTTTDLPILSGLGTPTVFDIGVYLVVIGVGLTIIFSLAER